MGFRPDSSVLHDRAVRLQRRAERLVGRPAHPFTHDQIALVAIAAKDACAWLQELQVTADAAPLSSIEESLLAQEQRLDGLESLVGDVRPEANPLREANGARSIATS